jgi:hypothetical protein
MNPFEEFAFSPDAPVPDVNKKGEATEEVKAMTTTTVQKKGEPRCVGNILIDYMFIPPSDPVPCSEKHVRHVAWRTVPPMA